jgi:RNA polymerase sigma factor (sigma-70 family)
MQRTSATCLVESAPVSRASESNADLLRAVIDGNVSAWNELVDRYGRLIWSIIRSFRLDDAAAADVSQTVWLRLTENCTKIHDPSKLASWLATTTRNESIRVVRQRQRTQPTDHLNETADPLARPVGESLLDDETITEAIDAFVQLGHECRQLLRLLCAVPPIDYATISEVIGRPIGSIGPTRSRCLDRLRDNMVRAHGSTDG